MSDLSASVADAAIRLLAVSDEASAGIGFVPSEPGYKFANFYLVARWQQARDRRRLFPYEPLSLCVEVPATEACVQPKSRTAQVGCTLRSLTHHLALLPSEGVIRTKWRTSISDERQEGPLNLLVVPFPYRIDSRAFEPGERIDDESQSAHFRLNQTWCERASAPKLMKFIEDLVRVANGEAGPVHGVVLPELSIPSDWATYISKGLSRIQGMELFVSGVLGRARRGSPFPRNLAYAALFYGKGKSVEWRQSKHHRWMLERSQLTRYGLGHRLPSELRWWEGADIQDRELHFYVVRPGASLAVLVCEDLARMDPIQPAIRAVGPSLVIALLLDGPQEERRWPGRYATVLADDPGSSVLSVTSLGMVRRSVQGQARPASVALWKDPSGPAREFALSSEAHALLLGLDTDSEENWTLDGRSDGRSTMRFSYRSAHEIAHPRPPSWV
jgi:hypothetical protein